MAAGQYPAKVNQGNAGSAAWPVVPWIGGAAVTSGNPLPVSGTVTANAGTGTFRVDPTGTTTQPVSMTNSPFLAGGSTVTIASQAVDMIGLRNTAGNASVMSGVSDSADGVATNSQGNSLRVASFGFAWNGTTWDRIPGSAAGGLKVDGSGVTQPVSGTVTANIGTTNGLALDTSVNGLLVAQGSTTSGEKGPLIQGAVTTGSPTYVTAQTSPLSLDTAGNLRVMLMNGNVQAIGQKVMSGSIPVAIASDQSTLTVSPSAGGSTGTITSAASVVTSASFSGISMASVSVHGTYAGVSFSISVSDDGGTTFYSVPVYSVNGNKWLAPGVTISPVSNGSALYDVPVPSGTGVQIKVTASAWTSGTANVRIQANAQSPQSVFSQATLWDAAGNSRGVNVTAANALQVDGSAVTQPVSGTVTANAGTGNFATNIVQVSGSSVATAAAGIMKVGLTDGTGTAITSTASALDVNIKSGGGSGFSVADETAWTAGTSAMVPAGAVYNDSATALTSGQEGTLRATTNRALHVNLRAQDGTQVVGQKTMANSIPVTMASDQSAIAVSGTVTANVGTTNGLALDATLTGGSAQAKVTDGTNVANVAAGDSGQNGIIMASSRKEVSFSTTTAQAVASADVSNYRTVSVHITSQGTNSTVNFQTSNDNTNWTSLALMSTSSTTGTAATAPTVTGMWTGALTGRFFRINVTGISAGTTAGIVEFFSGSYAPMSVGSQTVGNTGAGSTDVGSPVKTGGKFNTTPPTLTNGQRGDTQLDALGNTRMVIMDAAGNVRGANVTSGGALQVDGSAVTQPVSGTVTANAGTGNFATNVAQVAGSTVATAATGIQKVGLADGTGNALSSTAGSLNVNITGGGSGSSSDVTTTGTIAALNGTVSLTSLNGIASVTGIITGTWSASLLFEGTTDGTNWTEIYPTQAYPFSYNGGAISANATYAVGAAGYSGIRVRASAYTSGTATVSLRGSTAAPGFVTNVLKTTLANSTGSLLGGQTTMSGSLPVVIASDQSAFPVTLAPGTNGWTSVLKAAQSTTVATISSVAGEFGGYFIYNPNSSVAYLQVFDTTGTVTLGTTTPIASFGIPATSGANLEITNGLSIASGIKIACTTTANGSAAPTTGLDCTIFYH